MNRFVWVVLLAGCVAAAAGQDDDTITGRDGKQLTPAEAIAEAAVVLEHDCRGTDEPWVVEVPRVAIIQAWQRHPGQVDTGRPDDDIRTEERLGLKSDIAVWDGFLTLDCDEGVGEYLWELRILPLN